jgi:hypothetical protein
MRSLARVKTDLAARYLVQLCKHFGHRLPVEHTDNAGRIEFPAGVCALRAEHGELVMEIEASDPQTREELQGAVDRHLERFAFRDKPQIAWQPSERPGATALA